MASAAQCGNRGEGLIPGQRDCSSASVCYKVDEGLNWLHFATIMMVYLSDGDITIMPALTIKNIPDDLYNELKEIAKQNHRSINSEVIVCLERSLRVRRIAPEERLKLIRTVRSQIKPDIVSAEEIERAIDEGRP